MRETNEGSPQMLASMFSLDHRLSELRPSADELRVARQLREAADASSRRPAALAPRQSTGGSQVLVRPARVAVR